MLRTRISLALLVIPSLSLTGVPALAALTGQKRLPGDFGTDPEWRHQSHSGHHHSAALGHRLPFIVRPAVGLRGVTRLLTPALELGLALLDVGDRVLDGTDLLCIVVGNLDLELFLESHDQLDDVERVGAKVFSEASFGGRF